MSVWANLAGEITLPRASGFSVRKAIQFHFDESIINKCDQVNGKYTITVSIDVTFCSEGTDASKSVKGFIDLIKDRGQLHSADLTLTSRFLG